MASTTQLRITVADAYSNTRNINLPNPKPSITTLAQVNTAFKPAFDSDVLLTNAGQPAKVVKSARKIITESTDFS